MNAGPIPHGPSPSTSNFSWAPSVIERLYFDKDGRIQPVKITFEGVSATRF